MSTHDDLEQRNRCAGLDSSKALLSGRIGWHRGRPTRTFHAFTRGIHVGVGVGAIDYLAREGDYGDRDDLECVIGDRDRMKKAIMEIDRTARVRRGKTAEKVMVTQVLELPEDSSPADRKAVAEALVTRWEGRGHLAVAAVHANGKVQPHLHIAISARPVTENSDGWAVDRTPGQVALQIRQAVRDERQAFAELVNRICRPAVDFFASRDSAMERPGIAGRQPKRRLPQSSWEEGQRAPAPIVVQETHQRREEARRKAAQLANVRRKEKTAKQEARMARLGAVSAAELDRVRDQRNEARAAQRAAESAARAAGFALDTERARPPRTIEVVREIRVPVELEEDQKPASVKATKYLFDLVARKGANIQEDAVMTVGTVGATIRQLEAWPDAVPRQAEAAPLSPPVLNLDLTKPLLVAKEGCFVSGAVPERDALAALRRMAPQDLVRLRAATEAARLERRGDQDRKFAAWDGRQIIDSVATERGLDLREASAQESTPQPVQRPSSSRLGPRGQEGGR